MFDKATSQEINSIFGFLNNIDSLVFWVTNANFKKQLYLNSTFERIWGRSCESLLKDPFHWRETLIKEDLQKNLKELTKRTCESGTSIITFRIVRPDGTTKFIKDVSTTVFNQTGFPVAIVGIAEEISQQRWEELNKSASKPSDDKVCNIPFVSELLTVVEKEYKLVSCINDVQKIQTISDSKKKIVEINGQPIVLSNRQAECLYYLQQGKTAKQTAKLLRLSPRTIEFYLENLRKKVNCSSKISLLSMIQLKYSST